MKKTKILLTLLLLVAIYTVSSSVYAAGTTLLTVDSKVIKDDMKIGDITTLFGQPTVTTNSVFGGKAYSFTASDYKYTVYIETNGNGEIVSYGCVSSSFVSARRTSGDTFNNTYSTYSGYVSTKSSNNEIIGTIEYVSSRIPANYWTTYKGIEEEYIFGLNSHALEMVKIINRISSSTGLIITDYDNKIVDRDTFQYNRQLMKNDSNLYYYSLDRSLQSLFKFYNSSSSSFSIGYLPNPMMMADGFKMYNSASNYKYFLSDIYVYEYGSSNKYKIINGTVDPELFKEQNSVELTQNEKLLANNSKSYYNKYLVDVAINGSSLYERNVDIELPLDIGKIYESNLEAATDVLNMIRAGAGLDPVTHSVTISEAAQAKAVLTVYISKNGISNPSPHYPPQPDGVSSDIYNKAMTYMNENLYTGDPITSIFQALNDGYGDPINAGHRYNLLNPANQSWGVGTYMLQSCHKFSTTSSNTIPEVVAWPSAGVTPLAAISYGTGNWTCQFKSNYTLTDSSYVVIENLNTGSTYNISSSNANQTLVVNTSTNMITFLDKSVTTEHGGVRKVTIKNVKNSSGNIVDYTYRCVFLDIAKYEESANTDTISLSSTTLNMNIGNTNKLIATINNQLNIVKWESSNSSIATVDQSGNVKAISSGTATITATILGTNTSTQCTISIAKPAFVKGDINTDGIIDSTDAAIVLTKYKNNSATTTDLDFADMNEDGVLDTTDSAMILTIYKRN